MSLTYNGTEINQTSGNITYNGSTVKEVTMNGVSVWKKITTKQVNYSITDLSATKRSLCRSDFSKINKVVLKGTITQVAYLADGVREQTISVNKTVENPGWNAGGAISIPLADVWNKQSGFSMWLSSDSANPLVTKLNPGNLYASDGSEIFIRTISLRLIITYTPAE